ncbi:hypothetical protein GLW04_09395 [Halobacillus litoralis]|uniref:Uncharacterized protein n=1 Tax=Halobacillus litoralis TaxID=45668 RepID=A0A845DRH6_9BACI|nr:hypothetical protein [Halobacillus litoralis]MYL20100.1 hypothetical protein [Halobacillus litoralis]
MDECRLRGTEKGKAQALMTAACQNMKKTAFHPAVLGEASFSNLRNPQGAAPLPLLRKNEWAEIGERGFCEEARALVRGKGRGSRSWR